VLRKSYGGAHIAMNSKQLGADLVLAWPGATLGVMGAEQAVGVIHCRALSTVADPAGQRRRLAAEYADQHLDIHHAARLGFVDEVIEPGDTRDYLIEGLALLSRPCADRAPAGNIPL
jgi:acetyl-CoA carboxylase carboxyltransferase component